MICISRGSITCYLSVDVSRAASEGVIEGFEDQDYSAFPYYEAIACGMEGPGCFARIGIGGSSQGA